MRILLVAALTGLGTPLAAQRTSGTTSASLAVFVLDGANRVPLEGSRVIIRSLVAETSNTVMNTSRFAGTDGRAVFVRLDTGAYEIRVRRLGYAPHDTVIHLRVSGGSQPVSIDMRQLHFTLANVTIRANADRCVVPGLLVHDMESDLGVVLGAVAENAQREMTLRLRYPFTYFLARHSWFTSVRSQLRLGATADTTEYRGNVFSAYHVGGVVVTDSGASEGAGHPRRVFRIPTLVDLADSTFLQTHCFEVAGRRGRGTDAVAVVTFKPLDSIMRPDVTGEIQLDAKTLLLRRAVFSLTHVDSLGDDGIGFSVTTTYRVLAPGLAIMDEIASTQFLPPNATHLEMRFEEHQKLSGLHFIGASVPGYTARQEDEVAALAVGVAHFTKPYRDSLATLTGTIADEHGNALARAAIWIGTSLDSTATRRTETDATGHFRLSSLAPGPLNVGVRRFGSRPRQFSLTLPRGDSLVVAIRISNLVLVLPEVIVQAAPPSPLKAIGFIDRERRFGRAAFRDPDDLQRHPPMQLVDLLAGTMGVTIGHVDAFGGGTIPMGRGIGGSRCPMALYVDGQFINTTREGSGGQLVGMPIEDVVNMSDVRAAEIYADGLNVPAEFQAPGVKSTCGALVLWTAQVIE